MKYNEYKKIEEVCKNRVFGALENVDTELNELENVLKFELFY